MKNIKRILSLIIVMALLLTMMAVPAMAKDSDTNETDIIGSLYLSATPTTITVRGATGSYSFRIDDSTTWTTNATFSGLYPNTEHTVYAKTGSAPEITVGKITTKAVESHANGAYIDANAPKREAALTYLHSATFTNDLRINYYVPRTGIEGVYTNLRLYVEKEYYGSGSREYRTYILKDYDLKTVNKAPYYRFVFSNLAAKEMADAITVTLYADDASGNTHIWPIDSYCLTDYVNEAFEKSSSVNMKKLAADLVSYGAAAQTYFGYRTSALATSFVDSAALNTYKTSIASSDYPADFYTVDDISKEKATWSGRSVVFSDSMVMKFYVTFDASSYPNAQSLKNVTLTYTYNDINGSPVSRTVNDWKLNSGTQYTLSIADIAAKDAWSDCTIVVKDGSTQICDTLHFSIGAYARHAIDFSSSANMVALAKAVLIYTKSSTNYFLYK